MKRRIFLKGTTASIAGSLFSFKSIRADNKFDVAIIGAGLSGLNAALELEKYGLKTVVLEANNRVGGKLLSKKELNGNQEIGGTSIGSGYQRLNAMIDQLKLKPYSPEIENPYFDNKNILISLKNSLISSREDWIKSDHNLFEGINRERYPWESLRYSINDLNPLEKTSDWYDPKFSLYDISLFEALNGNGFSKEQIQLMAGINPTHGDDANKISIMQYFFSSSWVKDQRKKMDLNKPPIFQIHGGNDLIPKNMAKKLNGRLALNYKVSAIQKTQNEVEIYSNDREKINASCVISSVPLNALKNIHLDIPSINNRKIEAINSVGYSKVHMVYFKIKRPFWEYDELPNSMWTDSDIGRVFAVPGDNNEPAYLKTWATGSASGKLDSMSSSEVMAYVNKKIIEIRPALKDNIEPVFSWSWQNEVTAGGTYVAWLPGQIRKYSSSISQPNPPLFFAGEYTAKLDRGMEGAMESGERVANEVAKYLGAI